MTQLRQFHALGILATLICAGCQAARQQPRTSALPAMLEAAELASLEMSEAGTEGPAGVLQSDCGFTWILPRTNRYVLIETKDYLLNGVVRYLHDQEVYGTSLVIWPGPIDAVNHPELPETLNPAAYFRTRYTTNHP